MKTAKEAGFSDALIADLCLSNRQSVRKHREKLGLITDFRLVDTCANLNLKLSPHITIRPMARKTRSQFPKRRRS